MACYMYIQFLFLDNVDLSKKLPGMMEVRYLNGGLTYKSIIPIGKLTKFAIELDDIVDALGSVFPKPEAP